MAEPNLAQRLGYPADAKLVIINADDLGSCHSANVGVFECLATGTVTSATLMVPCPWAREASSRYRGEDIGVHLTLNAEYELYRWGPITYAPSLLGGDGGFPRTVEDVWDHADLDEVRRECRAQIERAILWGFDVSHLDAHMGTLQLRPEFFDVYLELAVDFGLPLRMVSPSMERYVGFPARAVAAEAGAVFTDHLRLVPGVGSRQIFEKELRDAPAGRDRVPPAPGRRLRRAALAGDRRLGGAGRRLPHDLRGGLGPAVPRRGGGDPHRLPAPPRVGPGGRLSQSRGARRRPRRSRAPRSTRGSVAPAATSSTSSCRPRASRSAGPGGRPRTCRGPRCRSGRSRSAAAGSLLTLRGEGATTPLVVPGWTQDDLEAVMRTTAGASADAPRATPAGAGGRGRPRTPTAADAPEPVAEAFAATLAPAARQTDDRDPGGPQRDPPALAAPAPVGRTWKAVVTARAAGPPGHRGDARAAPERRGDQLGLPRPHGLIRPQRTPAKRSSSVTSTGRSGSGPAGTRRPGGCRASPRAGGRTRTASWGRPGWRAP